MPKFLSRTATLACLVLVVGLAGCASPPFERESRLSCNHNPCPVDVDVVDCTISVPAIVEIHGKDREIVWRLDQHSPYVFAANGIKFKNPGTEFTKPHLTGNGKQFQWHDRNSAANDTAYDYSVTIEGCEAPLDPSILNRG